MRDWRGSIFQVGSHVIYPQRHGSTMWMVEARINEVTEVEKSNGKTVPALKVTPTAATWTHRIASKPVTLTALDRVTLVPPPRTDTAGPDGYCSVCHSFHVAGDDCETETVANP